MISFRTSTAELPAPPAPAAAHSQRVVEAIGREIDAAGGWISFERYMELALYAPGLGYYSAGSVKLGTEGDFVTAPEISPLFGRVVAHQCAEVLRCLGGGEVLELGAGTGRMAVQLLKELASMGMAPGRLRILEVSAQLRERQQATLAAAGVATPIEWLDAPPVDAFCGVVVGNEVVDALPVARFRKSDADVMEIGVARNGTALRWSERAAGTAVERAVRDIEAALDAPLADGYCSEVCPRLPGWLGTVTAALERGVVLLADYGHGRRDRYHATRAQGSLICHYRHHAHEQPLLWPGLCDISAWVDFTALAEAAVSSGLELAGYATQAEFLVAGGVAGLMTADADELTRWRQSQQLQRLTSPLEMGERFKCMAFARDCDARLTGFSGRGLEHTL